MYYTAKSTDGKLVCLIPSPPAHIIIQEDDTYTLVKGMFSISEIAYLQRSNDINGFLLYLKKYLADGGEQIIDFVGSESGLLAYKAKDKRVKEALKQMQSVQ